MNAKAMKGEGIMLTQQMDRYIENGMLTQRTAGRGCDAEKAAMHLSFQPVPVFSLFFLVPCFFSFSCRFPTLFRSVFSGLRCNVMTHGVMCVLTYCKSIIYQFFSYIFAVTT